MTINSGGIRGYGSNKGEIWEWRQRKDGLQRVAEIRKGGRILGGFGKEKEKENKEKRKKRERKKIE